MTQACAKLASATGSASGWMAISIPPAPMNGTTCAVVIAVHAVAVRLSRRSSTSGRQWTASSSGRLSVATAVTGASVAEAADLAARDRQAHDHELGAGRQLADLLGVALARGDHPEVALLELLAERPRRGLDRFRVLGRPLRQRGVTGVIHADETGHATHLLSGTGSVADATPPARPP